MNQVKKQKITTVRLQGESHIAVTIPKHVNMRAGLEPGQAVIVSSEKMGRVVIEIAKGNVSGIGRVPRKMAPQEIAIMKRAWLDGKESSLAARESGVCENTARNYYADFERGVR